MLAKTPEAVKYWTLACGEFFCHVCSQVLGREFFETSSLLGSKYRDNLITVTLNTNAFALEM